MIKIETKNSKEVTLTVDGKRLELCSELLIITANLILNNTLNKRDKRLLTFMLLGDVDVAQRVLDELKS